MSKATQFLVVDTPRAAPRRTITRARRPIGDYLLERNAVSPDALIKALALQRRQDLRLGDILLAHGMVAEDDLTAALAAQYGALPADLAQLPPDPRLIDAMGIDMCLREGAVPVRRLGGATIIATSRPEAFQVLRQKLPKSFGEPIMAFSGERDIHAAILATRNRQLTQKAETRVAEDESCRFWYGATPRNILTMLILGLFCAVLAAPVPTITALTFWALFTLLATTALKCAAAITTLRARKHAQQSGPPPERPAIARLPVVSVMVPLFHEEDIAKRLVDRLGRLTYPKELLDICLVTEADDETTRAMLARSRLPYWMRVITVPTGSLKTKPRALNFALDFCRGSIIGVYDAEDAPDPDQIHRIVRLFHERGPEVACLQGQLDFYNTSKNWFSRCFTIEYAAWFRIILPGIARMGLVVPLGGTTLFFRRPALESLGGWDAHNVTEDADLGIRLARHGYRTELVETTTFEEANCRLWPWVKQRSRWLKGYAMTWSVHMRQPKRLWRELGPWKFAGFQVMFLGTLSQFLLVPLMWSFWLIALGLPHPLTGVLPQQVMLFVGALFILTEVANIAIGIAGASLAGKRGLWGWVPSLHVYYPLAAIATYKAVFEMVVKPFYWDKTCHGIADEEEAQTP
ncbi:glycosyltransferase family 2 protein [Actibacterium lipolyticum]|uniref:Beta-monoglucosyldiacylglycerol synthase n=1 Tax=Actibacterium lipolyticum TaxID=1524263 RepID=A0A238KKH5_9RHOB|nr:glycosyltransferase family 2 protein [Actibacterium lipolyticum]SMX43230.1 Beta-monoglucosyldiacylglycerol synthase [Actibacterium lipolyticum]